MVITFLVHTDYVQSAKLLDKKRLPNQRREALQIINNIQRIKAMAVFTNNSLPLDPYQWYGWVRTVIKQYKEKCKLMGGQLMRIKGEWTFYTHDHTPLLEIDDLSIGYGYIYHPAVLMWLGYEDSLREYLDAHIIVSIERGINNNLKISNIHGSHRPPWSLDINFINRHRSMLLKKELDRNECPWYQLMDVFVDNDTPPLYFWPYTPSIGKSAQIQGEADTLKRYPNQKIIIKVKTLTTM